MVVRLAVVSIAFAFALGLSAPAGAQMHGGQPAQGPHPPQAAAMMGAEQMMRHADASMANLTTMMQHLNEMHAAMPGGTQHEQMMGSLQSMTAHMRQMHDTLGTMMHDPRSISITKRCRPSSNPAAASIRCPRHLPA